MKRKKDTNPGRGRYWKPVLALLLLTAAAGFGWWWKGQVYCRDVRVTGARFADVEALLEMARVDTSRAFFDLDTFSIADRVRRHPWVRDVQVRRLPDFTLEIEVTERTPALLAIDHDGEPAWYFDTGGHAMPFVREAVFDVPLLMGLREAPDPAEPVRDEALLALLHDVSRLPPEIDALVSSFELESDGSIDLYTAPRPGRDAVHVRLGHGRYFEKLVKLHAFWHQAVLPKKDIDFASIDLRFDSQIITRETRLSQ